jgi:hypothetical protein
MLEPSEGVEPPTENISSHSAHNVSVHQPIPITLLLNPLNPPTITAVTLPHDRNDAYSFKGKGWSWFQSPSFSSSPSSKSSFLDEPPPTPPPSLPRRTTVSTKLPRRSYLGESKPTKRPRRNNLDETTPMTTITRPDDKMSLTSIPNEVILEIGNYLTSPADLNSLVRTSSVFHGLLNDRLYKFTPSHKALLHTIEHDRISTMKRFIDGGLDVNMPIPDDIYLPDLGSVTLLRYSIQWRKLGMLHLLLKAGASTEMCYLSRSATTLYPGALLWGFGAKVGAVPPKTAQRMSLSNWNLDFDNGKYLIMDYPDVLLWIDLPEALPYSMYWFSPQFS